MPVHDDLGNRMKEYEAVPKIKLMKRTPVAIRIDGRAFHTFTKGLYKPFDDVLVESMQKTMKYLCENIQGCVFGYTQSDEITLILTDYTTFETSAWFDYEVQKICSIAASMATMKFNQIFSELAAKDYKEKLDPFCGEWTGKDLEIAVKRSKAIEKGAMFDARCFNISKEEVTNLIYWRQLDAMRNSVQSVGQAHFSHKELQGKTCEMIKEMLKTREGVRPWEEYPIHLQRGSACYKSLIPDIESFSHWGWFIDENMPILKGEGREYLERLI